MKRLDSLEASYRCCWWGFWLFIALLVVGWLTSCTTTERVVTVEKVKTDTTYITKHQRDSVWLHDSIRVSEKGDTIRIEKWHTKYIEREVHDTLYRAKHDSIPVPYPVTEYVERKRSTMEWGLIIIGVVALLGGIVWIASMLRRFLP